MIAETFDGKTNNDNLPRDLRLFARKIRRKRPLSYHAKFMDRAASEIDSLKLENAEMRDVIKEALPYIQVVSEKFKQAALEAVEGETK